MPHPTIDAWHRLVKTHNPGGLDDLLAEDAVFLSPIVHSPPARQGANPRVSARGV